MSTENSSRLASLVAERTALENEKAAISDRKFVGGIVGLVFFALISIGLGLIIWIWVLASDRRRIEEINIKLGHVNAEIARLGGAASTYAAA